MKLFYEDEYDALREAISSSDRSFKEVAQHLWPSKKADTAYARLKSCLNESKDEHLTFGEIVEICRYCDRFDPLFFMCQELSHEQPKPVTKQDELARLIAQYLEAKRTTDRVGPAIEKLRVA